MSAAADINTRTIIRAVHDLHDRTGKPAAARDIARFLDVPDATVMPLLDELVRKRILRRHKKRGEPPAWEPWV